MGQSLEPALRAEVLNFERAIRLATRHFRLTRETVRAAIVELEAQTRPVLHRLLDWHREVQPRDRLAAVLRRHSSTRRLRRGRGEDASRKRFDLGPEGVTLDRGSDIKSVERIELALDIAESSLAKCIERSGFQLVE